MARTSSPTLTDAELRLMKILWSTGRASVREVTEQLPPDRAVAYNTVQTLLGNQRLYDKTLSLATLLSLMHQEMNAGDSRFYRIAESQDDVDL